MTTRISPQRIVVVGTTGSGKSTLACQIADRLQMPFVELDALYWDADWTPVDPDVFQARVEMATSGPRWSVAGNYSVVRKIIWSRADTVVWLDYPLVVSLWRLCRRSIQRSLSKENLWGTGNKESLRKQFLSRESLFVWAFQTHWRRKRTYVEEIAKPEHAHLHIVYLRFPWDAGRWLETLEKTQDSMSRSHK
jgi:adenylate kinase family enzyme